jgi:tetratricopeptide (TPR) repeat protein
MHSMLERLKRACPPAVRAKVSRLRRIHESIAFRLVGRSHALASAGEYEKAIQAARLALRFQRRLAPAYEVLVQLLTHVGRYNQALDICARAFEMDVRSEGILASLRNILPQASHSDQPEEAMQVLKRCLKAFPQHVEVLQVLVDLLLSSRRYREAVLTCDRLLEVDPDLIAVAQTRSRIFNDPEAQPSLQGLQASHKIQRSDEYDRLVARNVADLLAQVMIRFYRDYGADISSVPLIRAINSFRERLPSADGTASQWPSSTLIVFEKAWANHQNGKTAEALRSFEEIFNDQAARRKVGGNPFIREAVVRSGELWGQYQERTGNIDQAIDIYRQILALDSDSVIARRLLLLLSRRGKLREAAALAETAIVSRTNLYPRLPDNPYIDSLKEELSNPRFL